MGTSVGQGSEIGRGTRVELALLGGIFVALIGMFAKSIDFAWDASAWAARMEGRVERIEDTVVDATSDRWSATAHYEWVEQLHELNPDLKMPSSRTPR